MITDRHVLTAAHCITNNSVTNEKVVLGVHERSDHAKLPGLEIEKITVGVYKPMLRNYGDIAIIKLKKPVKFENGLNPICLPNFDETDNMFAYGLGYQNEKGKLVQAKVMHEVELDRISQEECAKYYKDFKWNLNYTICSYTHRKNTSTCSGDSGSPVSTRRDGQVYQIAIVSMGLSTCNINGEVFPVAEEKVVAHLDWIRNNTQDGVFCEGTHHPFTKLPNNV